MRREHAKKVIVKSGLMGLVLLTACRGDFVTPPNRTLPAVPATISREIGWGEEVQDSFAVLNGYLSEDDLVARSCPHCDGITRPLKLGVRVGVPPGDRIASFTFDEHKPFIAYVRGT